MSLSMPEVHEELQVPAVVTREHLAFNSELRKSIGRLGFGTLTHIEAPEDVLVATMRTDGSVAAAGMLVKSKHLMLRPQLNQPEIHVHAGFEETVLHEGTEFEDITWGYDNVSVLAAGATVNALIKIAHNRDIWNLKTPRVGIPRNGSAAPLWSIAQELKVI